MPKMCQSTLCTGCTACASACPRNCIAMTADENGFLLPTLDAKNCVECGLCEKVCPVVMPRTTQERLPSAYAAYSRDDAVRMRSSSGGVFSEVAKTILATGGAVYGAAYNAQFDVVHICIENVEELARLRGAKYAQSDLRGVFQNLKAKLDEGQPVLFSGTPCQVAGLKAFLRGDYENLLTVDFVCHSVPSPMAWGEYVKYRAQQDNSRQLPQSIDLRCKETGWSRYQYANRFTYSNGAAHMAQSGDSLYMKLFVGGFISRECCENCHFKGYSRISDLTLGDFWGIWDLHPEMDDNKGTSVVLAQSDRGAAVLEQLRENLVMKPVTLDEASCQNPAMVKNTTLHKKRSDALQQIRSGKIGSCEAWFAQPEEVSRTGLKSRVRQLLARIKRSLR